MTEKTKQLADLSVGDLASGCAQQTSRRRRTPRTLDPCYELFRRACVLQCEDAWQAIIVQYRRLVLYWLGQHGDDDNCQEVFLRFWKGQQTNDSPFTTRFDNTSAIIGFLKACAATVRIEYWRKEEHNQKVRERLCDITHRDLTQAHSYQDGVESDLKSLVLAKLKNDQERALFELMYYYDLKPRDVQTEMPSLFPDTRTVYRVKENLLKRLRRDVEFQKWWTSRSSDDEHGGN